MDLSDNSLSIAEDTERTQRMYGDLAAFTMEMCDAASAAICTVDESGAATLQAIQGAGIERDAILDLISSWTSRSSFEKANRVAAMPLSSGNARLLITMLTDEKGQTIGVAAVLDPIGNDPHEQNRRERRLLALAPRISCELRAQCREREESMREHRRAFLHELTARLRGLSDPAAIVSAAIDRLNLFFGSKRAGFGLVRSAHDVVEFRESASSGSNVFRGTYPLTAFMPSSSSRMERQHAVFPTAACLSVMFVRDRQVSTLLYVHRRDGQRWTTADIELVEVVLERIDDESKRATSSRQLRDSEAQLRTVLESISDGFYALDANWRFTVINRAAENYFGMQRTDVLARTLWDVLPDARGSQFESEFSRVMASGKATVFEAESRVKAGRAVEVRASPQFGGGLAVTFSDITDRKRAEAAFKEREAHLAALYSQTHAGFAETNLLGTFVSVNDRFAEIVGRTKNELQGLSMRDITHADDLAESLEHIGAMLATGKSFFIEKRYVRPDGGIVWVANTVTLIRSTGQGDTTLAVTFDITDRKRAESASRANLIAWPGSGLGSRRGH